MFFLKNIALFSQKTYLFSIFLAMVSWYFWNKLLDLKKALNSGTLAEKISLAFPSHNFLDLYKNKICSPNIWNNKNLRFSFFENEKECGLNEKKKFNKEILKDINNIINDKYYFKNGKKKILIKRKFLCEQNSEIINGKHIDNINQYISKIQI